MGVLARVLAICATVACYSPATDRSCALHCQGLQECPNGFSCSNGFCAAGLDTCGSDGGVVDSPPGDGGKLDSNSGDACFGTAPLDICFPTAPSGVTPLAGFPTTDEVCPDKRTLTTGVDVCVVSGAMISLNNHQQFTGPRALVIVASQALTIGTDGILDVSSSADPLRVGSGSSLGGIGSPCSASVDDGPGGSFGSRGGASGGGTSSGLALPPLFHGGCSGSGILDANGGGRGGVGGGAVYLISPSITVAGAIIASGAGALGGAVDNGSGGGGGSGGYIGLEAAAITVTGVLVATGGGGGEGGPAGTNGGDPTAQSVAGIGGVGGVGGNGGDGGIVLDGATGGASPAMMIGAGGGGGGVGVIRFFGDTGATCMCTPGKTP